MIGNQTGYSIENFILHPLIILLYLSSINRDIDLKFLKSDYIKRSVDITESSIAALSNSELQIICNNFCSHILDEQNFSEYYPTNLIGFADTLDIPKEYRNMKGHDLNDLIIKKIPSLKDDKSLTKGLNEKNKKALSLCAAKFVFARHQKFIPKEFIDFFEAVP